MNKFVDLYAVGGLASFSHEGTQYPVVNRVLRLPADPPQPEAPADLTDDNPDIRGAAVRRFEAAYADWTWTKEHGPIAAALASGFVLPDAAPTRFVLPDAAPTRLAEECNRLEEERELLRQAKQRLADPNLHAARDWNRLAVGRSQNEIARRERIIRDLEELIADPPKLPEPKAEPTMPDFVAGATRARLIAYARHFGLKLPRGIGTPTEDLRRLVREHIDAPEEVA